MAAIATMIANGWWVTPPQINSEGGYSGKSPPDDQARNDIKVKES